MLWSDLTSIERAPYIPANSSFQEYFNLYITSSNYKGTDKVLYLWSLNLCHCYKASERRLTIFKQKKFKKETASKIRMKQIRNKENSGRREERNKRRNKALKGWDKRKKYTHSRGIAQRIQGDLNLLQKKISILYPIKNMLYRSQDLVKCYI